MVDDGVIDMNKNAISIHSVTKRYGGIEAIRSVSFGVDFGEITGLIGPNGAGKTTIIRMLGTLLKPDEGSIEICGVDALEDPEGVRRRIGVLPENSGLYDKLSVYQNIRFYASFYDINNLEDRIAEYVELFELTNKLDVPAGKLSKGMKEKVSIIRTIIHDPDVVILDEPFSGLDPDSRMSLKKLLEMFKDRGKAIFISSHELLEVENLCDKVILLDEGRILVDEYIRVLKERFKGGGLPNLEGIYAILRGAKDADVRNET